MKIKLRAIDGRTHDIDVSKLASVTSIKQTIKDAFDIDIPKQRLFYRGKQLEDQHTMYDYSVNQGDVIQVMERAILQAANVSETEKLKSEEDEDSAISDCQTTTLEDQITSPYFKIGDYVYCRDALSGAWNDGRIQAILKSDSQTEGQTSSQEDSNKDDKENVADDDALFYKVKLDLPSDQGNTELTVNLNNIRLCTTKSTKLEDVQPGMNFIANVNLDRKNEPGNWFEIQVVKVKSTRTGGELWADILMGESTLENCRIVFCHDLYKIEPHTKLEDRDTKAQENAVCLEEPCGRCKGNPQVLCKECNCVKCGGKDNPEEQILCDECNEAYHIGCLKPPLAALPIDDNWFCPDCKRDTNEIVKPGEELKSSKKKSKMVSNNKPLEGGKKVRDWGCGNATVGVAKKCTIVPPHHFGIIPGVEVGTTWQYRVIAAESGVHRPPVAGIHGRESDGAYSIVLSGGYEDDVDNGDEFFYTGSGGRDLSGNKRVAEQSSDQQLTNTNMALARNCNAPVNKEVGATAKNWKDGKPVRVLRGYKLAKHSQYAPTTGIRYDGLYKVVKYYPEKGKSGFIVWRYVLKRDDPTPAPWTPKGKKFIEEHGLEIIIGAKTEEELKKAKSGKKRKANDIEDESPAKKIKKVKAYELDDKMSKLVKSDVNTKIWEDTLTYLEQGKLVFMEKVQENFTCVCCQELVSKPVTTPCIHNMCRACLKRSFDASVFQCPCCRTELGKNYQLNVNDILSEILITLFPGYNSNR